MRWGGLEHRRSRNADSARSDSPVQRANERLSIHIDSGVSWQRLTAHPDHDVDFLLLRYEPGGESTAPESLMRHNGKEYGYILSGRLRVTIKESPDAEVEQFILNPGECMDINPGLIHQMEALEDAELYEFSTQHFNSDSHRLVKGD